MAFGFCCKRCGYQETPHTMSEDYPDVCKSYVSPDKQAERAMWRDEEKRSAESDQRKYRGPAFDH